LVIGEVQNLETDDSKKPLIYYRSKYQSLKDE
jgi:flavin reductase (DIM6/NTAB) family NADH-FMN oxidoreductase RutF